MDIAVTSPSASLVLNTGDLEITTANQVVTLYHTAPAVTVDICIPGPQGPVGPTGPAAGAGFTLPTESDIGGNRAVATSSGSAVYADHSTGYAAVGVSMGAVSAGADVTVQNSGKMVVTGAGWVPNGLIFLSTNGTLTQTEPTSGILQVIGRANTSEIMIIEIQRPIILT